MHISVGKRGEANTVLTLTPSASSKSGTGLPLQLETTILSPPSDAVTRKLSETGVTDNKIQIMELHTAASKQVHKYNNNQCNCAKGYLKVKLLYH